MVYTTEKMLQDNKDKVDEKDKANLEGRVMELKEVLKGEDMAAIKAKSEELAADAQKIGAAMYSKSQQGQPADGQQPEGDGSASSPQDGPQEAKAEEVKEEESK
jgi:molecular chaperone DnaK